MGVEDRVKEGGYEPSRGTGLGPPPYSVERGSCPIGQKSPQRRDVHSMGRLARWVMRRVEGLLAPDLVDAETHLDGADGGLGAVGDLELADYALHMGLDRREADVHLLGDLAVGLADDE